MRVFTVKVSKCGECPFRDFATLGGTWCGKAAVHKAWVIFDENRNGITPSCPMYSQSVEVAG